MSVIQQYQSIDLDTATYTQVNLSGKHSFYLISVTKDETIKSIVFSVAIDSGVTAYPLVLQNIELPVNALNSINSSTGVISGTRFSGFPDEFYLKPIQVNKKDDTIYKEGTFNVTVNINPVELMG